MNQKHRTSLSACARRKSLTAALVGSSTQSIAIGESAAFDCVVADAAGVGRWMTIRAVPDSASTGDVHGAFVLMNDIQDLKETEDALRATMARTRLAIGSSGYAVRKSR